jgi:GTP-binding protein
VKTYSSNSAATPLVAIVGRPNVGKSTLFNRLTGSRRAIVGDEPGITRDRLYGNAEWRGHEFRVVDTGGIVPEDRQLIPSEIFRQARVAFDEAAAIIMVVDGRSEIAGPDRELARLLLRTGKPLFLAVNKVDTDKQGSLVGEFHRLGIGEVFPVSAENANGLDDLLDAVLAVLPPLLPKIAFADEDAGFAEKPRGESARKIKRTTTKRRKENENLASGDDQALTTDHQPPQAADEIFDDLRATDDDAAAAEIKVAIIGHPNVGKSTLLNQLTGSDRAIVSPIPGTTRDAIDEVVEYHGRRIRFIDTAGIRRKGKTHLMAEKLSVVMSRKHLEEADIALFLVDATEGVSALDATIAGYAHESGRSVIIVVNKWDQIMSGEKRAISQSRSARIQDAKRPQDRKIYEERLRYGLKFLAYAPVVFISAETGKGTEKILPLIEQVAAERRKRISTSEMNRFLKVVDFDRASVPASKRVKIYYLTQAATAPPTFVLFTDRPVKMHFSYERFIENQIRSAFGFVGSPIWIKSRASE